MTERDLLKLKKEIDEAKTTMDKLQGQLELLNTQLKDTWECDTVEDAEAEIDRLQDQIDSLNNKIAKGVEEITDKYENI